MLSLQERQTLADGISRREWLRIGGVTTLGLSLPALLQATAHAAGQPTPTLSFGKARNVIWLFLAGGPSQYETFDPKPEAPAEIRGVFQPIATSVPGIRYCELLPRIARLADKLCVVRSLATDDANHESGGYWVNTGYRYTGSNMRSVSATDWPTIGSVVKMLKPSTRIPFTSVMLPEPIVANPNVVLPGQNGGFAGSRWDPDLFRCDPSAPAFQIEGFTLSAELSSDRVLARRSLLARLDRLSEAVENNAALQGHDRFMRQALGVLQSSASRDAFALEHEPPQVRSRYGLGKWGQSVLLARRLIEAGVRMVFVNWPREPGDLSVGNPLWDTHSDNNGRMRNVLCPQFDQGFSALIEDLDQRGLLDETLVVAVGEMGRTPRLNAQGGRDHWGNVFDVVLAGAGVRTGQTFGSSDRNGAYPVDGRLTPSELSATVFHLLGIGHDAFFHDQFRRPHHVTLGEPVRGLLR
jgi:hypothetical protein